MRLYSLIQIGVSYQEAISMPAGLGDSLLDLHKEVKEYEADEMERNTKQAGKGKW